MSYRSDAEMSDPHGRAEIIVCVNRRANPRQPSCAARGSEQLAAELELRLARLGAKISVTRIRCFGRCAEGPNVRIAPAGRFFRGVDAGQLSAIVAAAVDAARAASGATGEAGPPSSARPDQSA